jgi:hypothetical protein
VPSQANGKPNVVIQLPIGMSVVVFSLSPVLHKLSRQRTLLDMAAELPADGRWLHE